VTSQIRVAIIDSGVHADPPHVAGVAGGVWIREDGSADPDYVDRLGHGTAVAAVIKEKAPAAELYAVKVFDRTLSTSIGILVDAIDWAIDSGMHVVNLSLGTRRAEHEGVLAGAVARAVARDVQIVSARDDQGFRWLPGSLPGVVPVQLDWSCPRDRYRLVLVDGVVVYRASGFPRDIPGVPRERNLSGISFAVANMTGFLARALHSGQPLFASDDTPGLILL